MKKIFYFFLGTCLLSILGCHSKVATPSNAADSSATVEASTDIQEVLSSSASASDSANLIALAKQALTVAANKDYVGLADFIHPTLGIRFAPYTYVDTSEHKHFTSSEFRDQVTKNAKKKVFWGTSDPLSEPIKLTVEAYFKEFGYDKKYLEEGKFAYDETIGGGTTINNIKEIYPNGKFVEAYWVPKDEEKAPFEWGSIRLVFQQNEGKYFLVAWVHDAWST